MGGSYNAPGVTPAGTNLTIMEVIAATTVRGRLSDIVIGSKDTPNDIATEFSIIRGTVSGTGTAVTPRANDPAEPSAQLTAKQGTFTGQTKTANSAMLDFAWNQRTTFRYPFQPGQEIVIPATSDNWVGLESIGSGSTPSVNATLTWIE